MIVENSVIELLDEYLPKVFLTVKRKSPFLAIFDNGRVMTETESGYRAELTTNDFIKFLSMVDEHRDIVVSRYKRYFYNASYFLPIALYLLDLLEEKSRYPYVLSSENVADEAERSILFEDVITAVPERAAASSQPSISTQQTYLKREEDESRKFTPVDVHFATNRKPVDSSEHFSSERSDSITYGKAVVTVPADRKGGEIKRPFKFLMIKMKERKDKHFTIDGITCQSEHEFFESIRSKSDEQKLLVFVHGYNVDFNGAIYKTAQIKYDFGISEEPVILFSWPSKGNVLGYAYDKENSLYSRESLKEFLEKLAALGYTEISVMAHSMGGFCLAEAIKAKIEGAFSFSRLVLASADIKLKDFQYNYLNSLKNSFHEVALYVSRTDKALKFSEKANISERVGDCSKKVAVFDGIDTVDMSYNERQFFDLRISHSYFSDSDRVMDDLHSFIRNGIPASKRRLDKIDVPPLHYYRIKGTHS